MYQLVKTSLFILCVVVSFLQEKVVLVQIFLLWALGDHYIEWRNETISSMLQLIILTWDIGSEFEETQAIWNLLMQLNLNHAEWKLRILYYYIQIYRNL